MAMVNLLANLVLLFLLPIANAVDFPSPRAFFVFGDSLVDNGNNNYLATTARADGAPYGIDYPTHKPTGRFSNGFNIPDLIGKKFGLKPLYPYLAPELQGEKLLLGANFASAGVGILNDTGIQFMNIIRIDRQLQLFGEYQAKVRAIIGAENTTKLVDESLVLITLGGNDFINNYYLIPYSPRSIQFPLEDYCTYLVSEYRKVLKSLYDLGAKHVIVTGTGPLGCTPTERALLGTNGECAEELQKAAFTFNPKLIAMLTDLNKELGKEVFIGSNTNAIHLDFIENPKAFGFETSVNACCGQGPYNGIGLCTSLSNLCPNRDVYVFWDAFHPTEKANKLIVDEMFKGSTKSMNPMNLSTLKAMYF